MFSANPFAFDRAHYQRVESIWSLAARFMLCKLGNGDASYAVPWTLAIKVAAWMRHAVAEALRDEGYSVAEVNEYVLGHGTEGHRRHMSFVPVPSVGGPHPDGAIRRVMLVEPPDADGSISDLLQWKLAPSVLHRLVESNGGPRQTEPVCSLAQAPKSDPVFSNYMPFQEQRLWHSVTPVILHGHNSLRGKFSLRKTEELLYQAFEKSGYPRPFVGETHFQPAPLWPGTGGALAIRVPEHLGKWPRYHIAVRFQEPISGPLLVGIGRHYGIGLFAAPREQV